MSSKIQNVITTWLKNNPFVFEHRIDKNSLTLKECFSQKQISIDLRAIKQHRLKEEPQGHGTYLNLVLDTGVEIVLCHAGLAFSPHFVNTGPLPDAPPVSCLADYTRLLGDLKNILMEPDRNQEALLLFNVLVSILDGAKQIGMDVGQEEEELDKSLTEFEKEFQS